MLTKPIYDLLDSVKVMGETNIFHLSQIDRFICTDETGNYIQMSVPSYQDAKYLMSCYCKTELEGKKLSSHERKELDSLFDEHDRWREKFSEGMEDIMLDIETIGKTPGSVFVSIGAVYFDMETGLTGKKFYVNVDIQSAINVGLVVDASTLLWWMQQDEAVRLKAFGLNEGATKPTTITDALEQLRMFVKSNACVWGNGSIFDCTLLEVAYNKIGQSTPWQFWNVRDVRTAVDLAGRLGITDWKWFYTSGTGNVVTHDPVDDCLLQIRYLTRYFMSMKEGVKDGKICP